MAAPRNGRNGRGTLSVYLRRVTGLKGCSGAGASGSSGGGARAHVHAHAHALRVTLSICGQQQSNSAPLGGGRGRTQEWNQRFDFIGTLQDFMEYPLQIKFTSAGGGAAGGGAAGDLAAGDGGGGAPRGGF